jgi:chemotaxis receptor (MCP) glutamine deamidase CheD
MLRFLGAGVKTSVCVKEHTMSMADVEKQYSSPVHKLLPFFESSRNGWKNKCREAKKDIKRLKNQVAKLGCSRDRWKRAAQERASEVQRLRRELEVEKI